MAEENESWSCFVLAPISKEGSEIRKRSDQILRHLIRPAVEDECGYRAVRADEIAEPGIITSQIIQRVIEADLVIADLTEWNPNVFYELAVRHAIRRPVIHIIEAGEDIPFDVAVMRTITVDHHDLDSVEKCKKELVAHIRALEAAQEEQDSPLSVAIDLAELRRSDNPLEKSNAEILDALAAVRREVRMVGRRVRSGGDPDVAQDFREVRNVLEHLLYDGSLSTSEFGQLVTGATSPQFDEWVHSTIGAVEAATNDDSGEDPF